MNLKIVSLVILLFVVLGFTQSNYDIRTNYFSNKDLFLTVPSGKTLKILSFGYDNIVADLLYLYSIQLYSSYTIQNRYQYIEDIFNTITDLTPQYYDPYIVGSWIMALELGDIPMAMRLLEKGASALPSDWRFDFELGFNAYLYLKDFEMAEKYFVRAESKGAPEIIQRKRAHMTYLQDDLDRAWDLWLEIFRNARDEISKRSASYHLYQIKFERDKKLLEDKLLAYKERYNKYPMHLQELKRAGLISDIPVDFNHHDYFYDTQKGTIQAMKVFRWKQ